MRNPVQHVQAGDVVFHCGRGLISRIIRRALRCPWSHVSIVVSVSRPEEDFLVLDVLGERRVQSIQAHVGDQAWHARSPVISNGHYAYWGRELGIIAAQIALSLHRELPRSYPYLELLAYLPGIHRTRLGRCLLRKSGSMVCSAMVAAAWDQAGLDMDAPPGQQTPATLWNQANRDGWPVTCTKESYYGKDSARRGRR